jgi:4-amino-4-deoxy-L-arabinose transferase-like glycosyltransferase
MDDDGRAALLRKDVVMNMRSKRSSAWALVLVALGLLALYSGPKGLAVLIPAAILVWYAVAESTPRDHQN